MSLLVHICPCLHISPPRCTQSHRRCRSRCRCGKDRKEGAASSLLPSVGAATAATGSIALCWELARAHIPSTLVLFLPFDVLFSQEHLRLWIKRVKGACAYIKSPGAVWTYLRKCDSQKQSNHDLVLKKYQQRCWYHHTMSCFTHYMLLSKKLSRWMDEYSLYCYNSLSNCSEK